MYLGENSATFFDVGQGDCTLIDLGRDFVCLVDGGRGKRIQPHLPQLRRYPRLHLVVVTHPDADHIDGVSYLLDTSSRPIVDAVLLPPILHSTGELAPGTSLESSLAGVQTPARSPMLADHLVAAGLGPYAVHRALSGLEALIPDDALPQLEARLQAAVTELLRYNAHHGEDEGSYEWRPPMRGEDPRPAELERIPTLPDAGGPAPGDLTPERLEGVAYELEVAQLPKAGRVVVALASALASVPAEDVALAAAVAVGEAGAEVRRAMTVAGEAAAAVALNRLLQLMEANNVQRIVAAAPDRARAYGPIWHLAPRREYIAAYRKALPKLLEMVVTKPSYVPPPTPLNRNSHVIVFKSALGGGVMCTGDAGFEGATATQPDSLAENWESVLDWVSLVDVPHHGGSNGHFFPRMWSALHSRLGARRSPRCMTMYVSLRKANKSAPPHETLGHNLCVIAHELDYLGVVAPHQIGPHAIGPLGKLKRCNNPPTPHFYSERLWACPHRHNDAKPYGVYVGRAAPLP